MKFRLPAAAALLVLGLAAACGNSPASSGHTPAVASTPQATPVATSTPPPTPTAAPTLATNAGPPPSAQYASSVFVNSGVGDNLVIFLTNGK